MATLFPPSRWSLHADEWQRSIAEGDGLSPEEAGVLMFPGAPLDLPRRVWRAEERITLALAALDDLAGLVAGVRRRLARCSLDTG